MRVGVAGGDGVWVKGGGCTVRVGVAGGGTWWGWGLWVEMGVWVEGGGFGWGVCDGGRGCGWGEECGMGRGWGWRLRVEWGGQNIGAVWRRANRRHICMQHGAPACSFADYTLLGPSYYPEES